MSKPILCIMGPTACGKTDVALRLAQQFPIEIISVDSALVYRGMDIGTAKPSKEQQAATPHHLLDIINPNESYSVAQFCEDANTAINAIWQRNAIPILVGGSMMYFNALQYGLSELPPADSNIRLQLAQAEQLQGLHVLYTRLQGLDPISAARIKPQDRQRIFRALEVYMISGRPISAQQKKIASNDFSYVNLLLMPENRAWLHQRIAQRFALMIEQGFVHEVEHLVQQWPQATDYSAFKMVGYRQAVRYLSHQNMHEFEEKTLAATRQLAKRQLTWLRHWPEGMRCDPQNTDIESMVTQQLQYLLE